MSKKPKRQYTRSPDARLFKFAANPALSYKIINLSKERLRSMASTIRMLLWLGIEEYERNQLSGTTTKTKRQQEAAVKQAQAAVKAAQRERQRQGKETPEILTPMLYGSDECKALFPDDD